MLNAKNSPNKNLHNNSLISKSFGLFPTNNSGLFNDNNNNNKITMNPDQYQGNLANDFTKFLNLLPKSDFKRGFIKTQEDHHYFLLNEIQSNTYSKSFSAVKYIKKTNSYNAETNFTICDESFMVKFYPKDLLYEFFTESELIDFEYSLSKYKSLGLSDKNIQKIFEIIIANDCILVVTELFEHTLKEYLIKSKDICHSTYLTAQLEIRIEWYFRKLIYDIVNKLNEVKKKNIFFGALINTYDIYIRNINLDLNNIYEFGNGSTNNYMEEIDFVFCNPIFYEFETLFKLLNNGRSAFIYPPELLEHIKCDEATYGLVLLNEGIYVFRSKEEKELYKDKPKLNTVLLSEVGMKSSPLKKYKSVNFYSNIGKMSSDKIVAEINIKPSDSSNNYKENLKSQRHSIAVSVNANKDGKKSGIFSSTLIKNKKEYNLLVSYDQRAKFDSWMIGMLIFEIIFNKYPDNITQLKNLNEIKEFYFNELCSNISEKNKNVNMRTSIKPTEDDNSKIKTITEKKKHRFFTFFSSEISSPIKDLLNYCFKINLKKRVYPNFDDCTDEIIKKIKVISEEIVGESNVNEKNDENSQAIDKNYDLEETLEILKGEDKNKYVDFIRRKNEYVKLISERRAEYVDTFHSKFFFNQVNMTDKNEENVITKKGERIYL